MEDTSAKVCSDEIKYKVDINILNACNLVQLFLSLLKNVK